MLLISLGLLLCIMVNSIAFLVLRDGEVEADCSKAISEGHGDTAMVLLKAGSETDKKDVDGNLAIDLAPDRKVNTTSYTCVSA